MDFVLDKVQAPVLKTNTKVVKAALQKYWNIRRFPSYKIPNKIEQDGCGMKIKIDLINTDAAYNVQREFEHQASNYNYIGDFGTAEMVGNCAK